MKPQVQKVWCRLIWVALCGLLMFPVSPHVSASGSLKADPTYLRNPTVQNSAKPPADVSENAWAKIVRQIKEDQYRFTREASTEGEEQYRVENQPNGLRALFKRQGIEISPLDSRGCGWRLHMNLASYGFQGALKAATIADLNLSSGNLQYLRGDVSEWYTNDERGLEQWLTLYEPPDKRAVGQLVVEWIVTGNLIPLPEDTGTAIVFCSKAGESVLRYSGLKAWDAAHRSLPAKLAVRGTGSEDHPFRISYVIEAAGASYPVVIDPVFTQVKKLTAFTGGADDWFGTSVAISGDTLIVGAPRAFFTIGGRTGSAYIFYRDHGGKNNWGEVKRLSANDKMADDQFGCSVSISGDIAVVGAQYDDDNGKSSGSAYIFERDQGGVNNWGQVAKITASDAAEFIIFGCSVSISGDTVVVGAKQGHGNAIASGSAYIFVRDWGDTDNWGQVAKITAWDGEGADEFGCSVSISGDTAVVGAHYDKDSGGNLGSAYIFEQDWGGANMWGQRAKITASDGANNDRFGHSVCISFDTVVIGAHNSTGNTSFSGSAYIFERDWGGADNWGQVSKIIASDGAGGDYFGNSVSVSSDRVAVGAYCDDDKGDRSGSAYVFERHQGGANNWGQVAKITASDGAKYDEFGTSVSISGNTVLVGAYYDDDLWKGDDMGSAYVFLKPSPICSLIFPLLLAD